MPDQPSNPPHHRPQATPTDALVIDDEDVLDAMRHIEGYLDISTEDFRAIYRLAHAHARQRLLEGLRAGDLMLAGIRPLQPDRSLHEAAESLIRQGLKALPVVAADGTVAGMLTETDFLRCLGVSSPLALLLRLDAASPAEIARCRDTRVAEAMSAPAVCVTEGMQAPAMLRAFRQHAGRSMPVTDETGRLRGLLLRKELLHAAHADEEAP
jgi:CBS-domain-containing membrane protein